MPFSTKTGMTMLLQVFYILKNAGDTALLMWPSPHVGHIVVLYQDRLCEICLNPVLFPVVGALCTDRSCTWQ